MQHPLTEVGSCTLDPFVRRSRRPRCSSRSPRRRLRPRNISAATRFSTTECQPVATGGCRVIDDLLGSRLLVGNAELRFPLVGAFKGEFDYGPLPIEGFLFADTGVAWTSEDEPSFAGGERDFVSSVGLGVRANAFGYLVAEFNAVRPLDRGDRGWRFVFNLRPGF